MSVHREVQPDGTPVWLVRWREGGRNRGKRFHPRKFGGRRAAERAARIFDARLARDASLREATRLARLRWGA